MQFEMNYNLWQVMYFYIYKKGSQKTPKKQENIETILYLESSLFGEESLQFYNYCIVSLFRPFNLQEAKRITNRVFRQPESRL